MYTLFYAEGSAAMGARVMLEEAGAPYELVYTDIEPRGPRDPEFLKYNPNGWVPALVWDDGSMYECAAITIFLSDRYPRAGLSPPPDHADRGPFLQWLVYFSSTLQTAYQMTYHWYRFCSDDEQRPIPQRRAVTRLEEIWGLVDGCLDGRTWLLGDRFSAADLYLYMLTTWLDESSGHPRIDAFPNVARVAAALHERPSIAAVYGAGGGAG